MKLRELFESSVLLEYDRNKTASVFGNKLVNALINDNGRNNKNLIDLRNELTSAEQLQPNAILKSANIILAFIEDIDPTTHKEYTRWLSTVYANQGIKFEDLNSKGKDWLITYTNLKKHRILPPEYKDIGRITFDQLGDIALNKEFQEKLSGAQTPTDKGKSKEIYNDKQLTIIQPEDKTSACYYGQGTKWCTAATNNNMFDQYADEGPLYIIIPKHPQYVGEKYQLHFEASQFMDERDEEIDIQELFSRFPQLKKVFNQYRYIFSVYDWYGHEFIGKYQKENLSKFQEAINEKYKELGQKSVEELLNITPEVVAQIPHIETYIHRLLTEGFLARKISAIVTNFSLVADSNNMEHAVDTMTQRDEKIELGHTNDDYELEKSIWTNFKDNVAAMLWDQWQAMIKLKVPSVSLKNHQFSKLLLKTALEAIEGIKK